MNVLAWVKIVRPPIMLISAFGSLGCLILSDPNSSSETLILVPMIAALIAAGLMVDNDVWDLPSDRIRRNRKPLCTGAITSRAARVVGYVLMSLAFGLAFFLAWPALLYVFSVLALGAWYNRSGKRWHIYGHAATAYGVGGIILFPALASGEYWLWPLFLGIFLQEVGREIMVSIGDIQGDRAAGWTTLPVLVGRGKAHTYAGVFYALGIPVFVLGFVAPIYSIGAVLFGAILIIGWLDTREKMVIADVRVDPGFDKEKFIFDAYEHDLRLWSRLGVLIFQVCILLQAIAG